MARPVRILLLLLLSAAGAWSRQGPTADDPKAVVLAAFDLLHRQDWGKLYQVAAFSEAVTDRLPADPAVFAGDLRRGIGGGGRQAMVDEMLGGISAPQAGTPDIHGDYATLSTTCTLTVGERKGTFKGTAHLIRRNHAWKWDLTFADKPEEALARALSEIIGQSADKPGPPPAKDPLKR